MRKGYGLRLAALLLAIGLPRIAAADGESVQQEIKVERRDPGRAKLESLRFLHANRDFLRARLDLLRQRPGAHLGQTAPLD